jgi:L-ascorbate 6-phosphate lactonase
MVDPYLSDCCERYFGFRRLMPHLLRPGDIQPDLLIATHAHYDHFDPDSVPILMAGRTKLIAAKDCRPECERLGIRPEQVQYMACGDEFDCHGIGVRAVACDHGGLAPDAVGLLLNIAGKRIYIAGDTAFRAEIFSSPSLQNPDLAALPINGAFGNMNEQDAAKAAAIIKPKLTVPCHFWNFAEHGGNPGLFAERMKELAPGLPCHISPMGGHIVI